MTLRGVMGGQCDAGFARASLGAVWR